MKISVYRLFLFFGLVFSLYSSVHGGIDDICNAADQTYLQTCLRPLISNLPGLLLCSVACSAVTNLALCINQSPFTARCLHGLEGYLNGYLGSSCSYERIREQCPESPDVIVPEIVPEATTRRTDGDNEGNTGGNTDECGRIDRDRLHSCLMPFIDNLPALMQCTVTCSDVTDVVTCVNTKSLTEACVRGLPEYIDKQAATFGSSCTYYRLKSRCPDAPDLIYPRELQTTETTPGGPNTTPRPRPAATRKTNGNGPVSSATRFVSVRSYLLITLFLVILLL